MVPSKKRRTAVTESPQHQGTQEEGGRDLESAGPPGSEQVDGLGSSSLLQGLEAPSVQDAARPLGVAAPSVSSALLAQDAGARVPEAVGAAIPEGSALASPESSRPRDTHPGKENLQAAGAKRGKKMTLRPRPVPQEDRSDPPVAKEPFPGEPSEEVQEEGELRRVIRLRFCPGLPWPLPSPLHPLPLRATSGLGDWLGVGSRSAGDFVSGGTSLPPVLKSSLGPSLSPVPSGLGWGDCVAFCGLVGVCGGACRGGQRLGEKLLPGTLAKAPQG